MPEVVYSATQALRTSSAQWQKTAKSTETCRKMTREGFLEGNIVFMCQL